MQDGEQSISGNSAHHSSDDEENKGSIEEASHLIQLESPRSPVGSTTSSVSENSDGGSLGEAGSDNESETGNSIGEASIRNTSSHSLEVEFYCPAFSPDHFKRSASLGMKSLFMMQMAYSLPSIELLTVLRDWARSMTDEKDTVIAAGVWNSSVRLVPTPKFLEWHSKEAITETTVQPQHAIQDKATVIATDATSNSSAPADDVAKEAEVSERCSSMEIGIYNPHDFYATLDDSSSTTSCKFRVVTAFLQLSSDECEELQLGPAHQYRTADVLSNMRLQHKIKLGIIKLAEFLKGNAFDANGQASHVGIVKAFQKCAIKDVQRVALEPRLLRVAKEMAWSS